MEQNTNHGLGASEQGDGHPGSSEPTSAPETAPVSEDTPSQGPAAGEGGAPVEGD